MYNVYKHILLQSPRESLMFYVSDESKKTQIFFFLIYVTYMDNDDK